jgi:hypothetical protein
MSQFLFFFFLNDFYLLHIFIGTMPDKKAYSAIGQYVDRIEIIIIKNKNKIK